MIREIKKIANGDPLIEKGLNKLYQLSRLHLEYNGGMHTNGGCKEGRCDFGCSICSAFSQLIDIASRDNKNNT